MWARRPREAVAIAERSCYTPGYSALWRPGGERRICHSQVTGSLKSIRTKFLTRDKTAVE